MSKLTINANEAQDLNQIYDILSYRRADGSPGEGKFISDYLDPIPDIKMDLEGNYFLRIGDAPVLWSCHTDTVHRSKKIIEQEPYFIDGGKQDGWLISQGNDILGADDGAGLWIMLQMIEHKIPGLYVFHRAEEVGGHGSMYFAKANADLLSKEYKMAIAFDRKGTKDIITHQFDRCCSDNFALSLAKELDMGHVPDSTGIFTDTANYTDLIPECTNISVGYENAHSNDERLDWRYLIRLRDAILSLDINRLVVERDPADPGDYGMYGGWRNGLHGFRSNSRPSNSGANSTSSKSSSFDDAYFDDSDYDYDRSRSLYGAYTDERDKLLQLVKDYPEVVVDVMEEWGMGPDEIEDRL